MLKKEKKVPELRFTGFEEDWEWDKLGEISDMYQPTTISQSQLTESGIPVFGANGYIGFYKQANHSTDQVTISARGEKTGTINFVSGPVWITGNSMVVNVDDRPLDKIFLFYDLRNMSLKKYITGGAQPQLTREVLDNIPIFFPSEKDEQSQIGEFFENLDDIIEFYKEKLKKLKKLKQAYLQVIFPRKGEKVPKLRISNFHGEWNPCNLGSLVDITTGKLDANAMVENGKYDFYTSGIKKYKIDIPSFEGPAITIAGNGATVGHMHLADGEFNAYQRTYVLTNFKIDRQFIFAEIGNKLPRKIAEEARTGNIPYIVLDMLTELKIMIPSPSEAAEIGKFFKNFDDLIDLQRQKIDRLESLKKAYLQKMFV